MIGMVMGFTVSPTAKLNWLKPGGVKSAESADALCGWKPMSAGICELTVIANVSDG